MPAKKTPTPNSHPVLAVVSQYSAGHHLRKASLRNTPLPVQRNSTSRRLTYDSLCKLTGPQLFQHKPVLLLQRGEHSSQVLISVFLEHSAVKQQKKPQPYTQCATTSSCLLSVCLFAREEESVLNFFSFFSLSHPHFFSHSTLQVKVSEPQNSIDMNTENEHLKSIKMCLNQPTEWNLSFSAASLASCKVFNQNLKTDENK